MDKEINNAKALFLSADIYSEEAVKLAAYVLESRIEFSLEKKPGGFEIIFNDNAQRYCGIFANEALNQQCRLDLAAHTGKLTGLIVTKALLSATGAAK